MTQMTQSQAKAAFRAALSPPIVRRSICVAAVVGTLLNVINQGDVLFGGGEIHWLKLVLTYFVPFCVSTFGAYSAIKQTNVSTAR